VNEKKRVGRRRPGQGEIEKRKREKA